MVNARAEKEVNLMKKIAKLEEKIAKLERELSDERSQCSLFQGRANDANDEVIKLKEKLIGAEGQLKERERIIDKLLGQQAQNITVSGDGTVNIVSRGSINDAEGQNARIESA